MTTLPILLVIVILAILTFTLGLKALKNFQPNDLKVSKDLLELKKSISTTILEGLEDWNINNLDALSTDQIDHSINKGRTTTAKGIFLNNNQDPIFGYVFKRYAGQIENAVLLAITALHEFEFRITTKGVQISIDGVKNGLLKKNGKILGQKSEEIGELKKTPRNLLSPIKLNNKDIGKILNPKLLTQRAQSTIQLNSDLQLSETEILMVKALSIYELAYGSIDSNQQNV